MVFQGRASFRNVHCAICNGAALDMVVCLSVAYLSRGRNNWQQNFNTFSFAVLLDINGGSDVGVGKRERQPRCLEVPTFIFIQLQFIILCPQPYYFISSRGNYSTPSSGGAAMSSVLEEAISL